MLFSFSIDQEKCAHDSWLCGDGKCIKKIGLCDGHRNCPDNSDEDKTFCRSRICGSNKFHCRTGECILKSEVRIFVYFFILLFT